MVTQSIEAIESHALKMGTDGNRRTVQSQNEECVEWQNAQNEIIAIAEYGNRRKRNAQNGQNKRQTKVGENRFLRK